MMTKKDILPVSKPELPIGFNKVIISKVAAPFEKPNRGLWTIITFSSLDNKFETRFHCLCELRQFGLTSELFRAAIKDFSFESNPEICLSKLNKKQLIVCVVEVEKNYRIYHNIVKFLPIGADVKTN